MSRDVPHFRPEILDSVRVSVPVGSFDWAGLGALANWSNGHGGMLIPWTAIGHAVGSGNTATFRYYVAPKAAAVERIWVVQLRASAATGVSAEVTVGGASLVTVRPSNVRDSRVTFAFRESLSAKTSTAAGTLIVVKAVGGTVTVESVAMYEQTRSTLDGTSDDNGVDLETLRPRSPIADLAFESVAGVIDGYKNLDARRAGYWHWATDTTVALAITAGSGSPLSLFAFSALMAGPVITRGDTQVKVTCAVLAKVNAGTGTVRFQSDDAGASVNVDIVQTSYTTWATDTLSINAEDLTVTDGRRGPSWEGVAMDAWVTASDQLDIQALSIIRTSSDNPI